MTITKAIYATGWDGDVLVTADLDGNLKVDHHPKPSTPQTADERRDVSAGGH